MKFFLKMIPTHRELRHEEFARDYPEFPATHDHDNMFWETILVFLLKSIFSLWTNTRSTALVVVTVQRENVIVVLHKSRILHELVTPVARSSRFQEECYEANNVW